MFLEYRNNVDLVKVNMAFRDEDDILDQYSRCKYAHHNHYKDIKSLY